MSNDTKIDLAVIQARYEAAKTMPPGITAAKRVHIQKSDHIDNWWVGFGKDEICQIEGTPNHWRWAAMLILGLADRKDAPYTEDKPTPEVVPALLEQLAQAAKREATVRELEQSNRDLADVLQDLCDVQNGPPLPKYEAAWSDTMELAERLLEARAHLAKESHDAK